MTFLFTFNTKPDLDPAYRRVASASALGDKRREIADRAEAGKINAMGEVTIQQALNLAVQHHQAGRLGQAEQLYRQVLAREPGNINALHLLGVVAGQVGRNEQAVDLIRQAISLKPDYFEALKNLGMILSTIGRLDEAIATCLQALTLQPKDPELHNTLGNIFSQQKRPDQAMAAYYQAITLKRDYAEPYSNLGNALLEQGRLNEAIAAHRQAIALRPNHAEAHNNLGNALSQQGQMDEAIVAFCHAIALKPTLSRAHSNLGNALRHQGRLDEALAAYRRAIELEPNLSDAHTNFGNALADAGRLDEAVAAYQQAIALNPNSGEAHHNLAVSLLTKGEFPQGWQEYEWRWQSASFGPKRRDFAQSQWDGSSLSGRVLLLHAEQGFGDAIHFIRYLPMVLQRGGQVVIECQPELRRLLQMMAGTTPVIARGDALPQFDVQCPLLSLPKIFGTTLASIPHDVPYLQADAVEAAKWGSRLAGQSLKVGLAWAGRPTHKNDHNRSITLAIFAPLAQVPGVQFFSLQKGRTEPSIPVGMDLIDWTAELNDFADTEALVANLDLIISVDTAMAHLAGAMGKPVWTLVPFAPDWRWMLNRQDSPWYPTMRLFRQPAIRDWESVIRQVVERLSQWPK